MECSCRLWPSPGMYAVTSVWLVSRTRATLRSAEFGFFGVVVYTRVHTPRRCGEPLRAGVFDFPTFEVRPLRTSCWIVGTTSPLSSRAEPGRSPAVVVLASGADRTRHPRRRGVARSHLPPARWSVAAVGRWARDGRVRSARALTSARPGVPRADTSRARRRGRSARDITEGPTARARFTRLPGTSGVVKGAGHMPTGARRRRLGLRRRAPVRCGTRRCGTSAVVAEVQVLERDRLAGAHAERREVDLVVAEARVELRLRLLGGLDLDLGVPGKTGTGRDELTDDDVLLEAEQRVATTAHRRLGEHAGRLLEGGGREPRVGRERRLRDAHELGTAGGRLATLRHGPAVRVLEAAALGELARQEVRVARVEDRDPTQHLAHDDLDVLVVDVHALGAVDLLDLVHQVLLRGARAEDAQDLLRVHGTLHELRADGDVLPVLHEQARTLGHRVGDLLGAVVRGEDETARALGVVDRDAARELRDGRLTLGGAGLEELRDTRQTLRDVVRGRHTTGVEGTHRQLRARLADRLGRDDAHGLADVDELARRERAAVALGARADARLARQDRADLRLADAGLDGRVDEEVARVVARLRDDVAVRVDEVGREGARVHARLHLGVADEDAPELLGDRQREATLRAAVLLADDDVLRDVHQTTREVARVGGPQRGVRQTLAGAVRRDEVLEDGQALAVVGLDRARDDLALRVRHEAAHAGDLTDLHPVTTGTRADHAVHGVAVVRLEVLAHDRRDLVRRLGPDLDELLTALVVRDETTVVLLLDLERALLVLLEDDGLLLGRRHVGDRDRDARAGRPAEAGGLQRVERRRDLDLRVALRELVDDRREALLVDDRVHVRVVDGERLVEQGAT